MTDRSPLVGGTGSSSSSSSDAADRLEGADGDGEGSPPSCPSQRHMKMRNEEDIIGSKYPLLDDLKTDLLSYLNEYLGWFCPLETPLVKAHSDEVGDKSVSRC